MSDEEIDKITDSIDDIENFFTALGEMLKNSIETVSNGSKNLKWEKK